MFNNMDKIFQKLTNGIVIIKMSFGSQLFWVENNVGRNFSLGIPADFASSIFPFWGVWEVSVKQTREIMLIYLNATSIYGGNPVVTLQTQQNFFVVKHDKQ